MPQVSIAAAAVHGRAAHSERLILHQLNILFGQRLPETRPACTGFKLCLGAEQRSAAADATVNPVLVHVPVLARERAFGAFMARHLELLGGKLAAPFVIALHHFRRRA